MIFRSFAQNDLPMRRELICPIRLEFPAVHMHLSSMTIVMAGTSEKEVRQEVKALKAASSKVLKSKESARAYLLKNGYITKTGKLAKRYGG